MEPQVGDIWYPTKSPHMQYLVVRQDGYKCKLTNIGTGDSIFRTLKEMSARWRKQS